MDFGSFENTIDKNIETDKASDKFDQQLQAYKDACNSLTSAKSELEKAASSLQEAKDNLNKNCTAGDRKAWYIYGKRACEYLYNRKRGWCISGNSFARADQ